MIDRRSHHRSRRTPPTNLRRRSRPGVEGLEGRALLSVAPFLDNTFGTAGTATYNPFPAGSLQAASGAQAVAVQPNGEIVLAGTVPTVTAPNVEFAAVRLNANGTPDATFASSSTLAGTVTSVAVTPTGRILIGGAAETVNSDGSITTTFGLQALLPTGLPDTTFDASNGHGVFTYSFQSAGGTEASQVNAILVQPDGKIILVGQEGPSVGMQSFAALRLNADGTIDKTFGGQGSGAVTVAIGSGASGGAKATSAAFQPDGKILLAGIDQTTGGGAALAAVRLNADGTRDTTFGTTGIAQVTPPTTLSPSLAFGDGVAVQPGGKIVLAGSDRHELVLARLNPDGSPDVTFGGQGTGLVGVTPNAGTSLDLNGNLVVLPGGKIVLAAPGSTDTASMAPPTEDSGILARFNANGTPDATFVPGGSSIVVQPVTGLTVQPNGRAVVALQGPGFVAERLASPEVAGDYTGDGKADQAVYLPLFGAYAIRPSEGTADKIIPFGIPGAGQSIPAPGDYSGSGKTEVAVYLSSLGALAYRPANGGPDVIVPFGIPGVGKSIPAPGDYYGTGVTDVAIYIPQFGAFAVRPPTGPDVITPFGIPGAGQSLPVPGDYSGSGKTELAVYLPSLGAFAYRPANGGPDVVVPFGIPGGGNSIPAPGDYDGSGKTELGVYLPALGDFVYRPAKGGPDVVVPFGVPGFGQTIPAIADYTGIGHDEIGAYLSSFGAFAYRPSTGPDVIGLFGIPGAGNTIPANGLTATPPTGPTVIAASVPTIDVLSDATPSKKARGTTSPTLAGPSA